MVRKYNNIKGTIVTKKPYSSKLSLFFSKYQQKIEEFIIVISISIMGLLLRIPYISSYDPKNDGYWYLNNAKDLYNLKFPERYFPNPGFSFLSVPFIPLFGDQACVATSLFFSILSIPMTYKLTTKYYNNYAGYFSALLFATTPLHIFWSGRDYSDITGLFWIIVALYYHFSNDYNKSTLLYAFAIFVRASNLLLFPFLLLSSNNQRIYLKYSPLFLLSSSLELINRYFWSLTYPAPILTEKNLWRNLYWCKDGVIGWSMPYWGMWENYFITAFFLLALLSIPKKEEIKMVLLWFAPFLFYLFWYDFQLRFFFPILLLFCMTGSKTFKILFEFSEQT